MTANATANPGKPEQLPLDFRHEAASGRDDLVISDPVSAAAGIIDRWPDWPSPVVIISGPEGSGKSHLAEVWVRKSRAARVVPVHGSDAVIRAGEGPVLVEDADREGFDETELFHLINAVRSAGTSLLITARSWPMAGSPTPASWAATPIPTWRCCSSI